jgi:hypothetical protein
VLGFFQRPFVEIEAMAGGPRIDVYDDHGDDHGDDGTSPPPSRGQAEGLATPPAAPAPPPAATPPAATPPATTPPATTPPATPVTPTPTSTSTTTTTTTTTCGGSAPANGSATTTAGASCSGSTGGAAGGSAGSALGPASAGNAAGSGSLVTAVGSVGASTGAQAGPPAADPQRAGADASSSPSATGENVAVSGSGPGSSGPSGTSTKTTLPSQPSTSDPANSIGIAATLAGGYRGAPTPVGTSCAGTGSQAGCDSFGPPPPPLPGIADARRSPNLTIAALVSGFAPSIAGSAPAPGLTALASSTRPSVIPPAASLLGRKADPDGAEASPPAVQPQLPEVATGTRGPKAPQGGAGSFAGGASAPSTLIIMLAFAVIAARWFSYVKATPIHLQTAEGYRLERPG